VLTFDVLINCIKIAVPDLFKIMLVPIETAHNTVVGIDTVNDNIKKVIPTEALSRSHEHAPLQRIQS
jgi:hypothetical protein